MRVLSIVHQIDAGSGVFGQAAERRGDEVVEWIPVQGRAPGGDFDAVMVFGGGMHPHQEEEHPWLRGEKELLGDLLASGTPVLGVCLGAELLAEAAGAPAGRLPEPQIGWHEIELTAEAAEDPVLAGLPPSFTGFQWHSYTSPLPAGGVALAGGDKQIDAYRVGEAWGIQFHAEVTREIVEGWLDRYRADEDAVAAGLDPEPVRAETEQRIAEWNEIGRRLCTRFLEHAERLA